MIFLFTIPSLNKNLKHKCQTSTDTEYQLWEALELQSFLYIPPQNTKFFDALSIKSAHFPTSGTAKVFNASVGEPKNNLEHPENKYNKYITKVMSKFCSRESR